MSGFSRTLIAGANAVPAGIAVKSAAEGRQERQARDPLRPLSTFMLDTSVIRRVDRLRTDRASMAGTVFGCRPDL